MSEQLEPLFDAKEIAVVDHIRFGGTCRNAKEAIGVGERTIFNWLSDPKREAFRQHYMRAREDQADAFADKIVEIIEHPALDPADKRVRMDALKWIAGKRKPKVYGDKVTNEHTGVDGAPLMFSTIYEAKKDA